MKKQIVLIVAVFSCVMASAQDLAKFNLYKPAESAKMAIDTMANCFTRKTLLILK